MPHWLHDNLPAESPLAQHPGRKLPSACLKPLDAGLSDVRRLIKAGADVDWSIEPGGTTPLISSAFQGNFRICETLLKKGAAVDKASRALTPLLAACVKGHEAVARLLLRPEGPTSMPLATFGAPRCTSPASKATPERSSCCCPTVPPSRQ